MNIDTYKFKEYLLSKRYALSYVKNIIYVLDTYLLEVSLEEALNCPDATFIVERVLKRRYNSHDHMCSRILKTLHYVVDYYRDSRKHTL